MTDNAVDVSALAGDSSGGNFQWYTNITLVNAPDGDLWGDLVWDSNGTSIDESFGLASDDYFSTWDTPLNGTGGSFTLMLNWTDFGFFGYTGGAGGLAEPLRAAAGRPEGILRAVAAHAEAEQGRS